ncbi:MAG: c-type cytochrome [Rhodoferax sp.]|nr:c-type cytochrome [Rhodoferax sp.]
MNKLLLSLSALLVASVTAVSVHAEDIKGDAKAGEKKNAMCIGCHGIVGYQASFPEIHKVPKISGQGAGYIAAALNAYKKGERKHASMRGIAESLTDKDIADLAAYYAVSGAVDGAAALGDAPAATGKTAELLAKGNCESCHGKSLSAPIDPSYPKIAGQHGDYLLVALKSYKVENNAQVGRNNAIMGGIAKQFSNAELKIMAKYLSSIPGELKTVPEKRFR